MKWLIVEDALRDRWGHWVEYLRTFRRGLEACGDEFTILCDRGADPDLVAEFGAKPVLPPSIWHRMSDGAGALKRYARVPGHGCATFFALRRVFSFQSSVFSKPETRHALPATQSVPDVIFVPTVLVHHLLGWWLLLKTGSVPEQSKVLLFFPNLPLRVDEKGEARWNSAPTTKLMLRLFRAMRPWIEERRVILGVETKSMRSALAQLIGLPVVYLPHPVSAELKPELAGGSISWLRGNPSRGLSCQFSAQEYKPVTPHSSHVTSPKPVVFACYGGARAEKGSDVFQEAIKLVLSNEVAGVGGSGQPERSAESVRQSQGQMADRSSEIGGRNSEAKETGKKRATANSEQPTSSRPIHFAIQWIEDFKTDDGRQVRLSEELAKSERVEVIRRLFVGEEYEEQLARTDVMVLPYQSRSYRVRVSRVVIEAMVRGMPLVATQGTTIADQVREFGEGLLIADGDPSSLAAAMERMAAEFPVRSERARGAAERARAHFSVANFKKMLMDFLGANWLILGDSHVAGLDWPGLSANCWSYSVPGATSQRLLELAKRAAWAAPAKVLLWCGTNDVLQDVPAEQWENNMRQLVAFFLNGPGRPEVFAAEVPPFGEDFAHAKAGNTEVARLNGQLAAMAGAAGIRVLPVAGALGMETTGFLSRELTNDGVHLNEAGYDIVARLLRGTDSPGFASQ